MRHQQYYQQRRKGGTWLIVLIIVVGVIIYANSKGIINLGSMFGNINLGGSSVNSCIQKVNDCAKPFILKNNYNMTVIGSSTAANETIASQFLSTWKDSSQSSSMASYNVTSYPIALVATRFDTAGGPQSHVFICKSDGNLEEATKGSLC